MHGKFSTHMFLALIIKTNVHLIGNIGFRALNLIQFL